jgi:hypothetical protein
MKQNVVKQYLEVEVRKQGLIGGEWIQVSLEAEEPNSH